ncbi:AGAP005263-PA-like protein [Anopheles sinensis]|uniref:AGAP005263-PA-like protein n=1 Tax=Anopheles sinensis TaxID=74873 RepID=A0A084W9M4_ANOSI|nr:AGAP005263-PA-like protein [Anopheles sinensis]
MSNPPQYYGMPNGFPHSSNGQTLQQQQFSAIPPGNVNPSKGSTLPNGPPSGMIGGNQPPPHQAGSVKPVQPTNGPPMAGQPGYSAAPTSMPYSMSSQQYQQRIGNWPATNGNSATSSRTASPALGSAGMPPVSVSAAAPTPPASGVGVRNFPSVANSNGTNNNNNNHPPMASSQSQATPIVTPQSLQVAGGAARPTIGVGANNGYNLSPNNNWSGGNVAAPGGNLINTPPKSASGMSTPLNASTPTLTGPLLAGGQQQQSAAMQKLAGSIQDLNLNRPPTQQPIQPPFAQQHAPPTMSNGSSEQTHAQTNGTPMATSAPQPGMVRPTGNVLRSGFNRMWGNNTVDLLQNRHVLPTDRVRPPTIHLLNPNQEAANCNPDIFRCTLTKIPDSSSLLQKSRLPLGILIHPFRDLNNLPVISCNTIVRCRTCRTYINPFVFFTQESKKWKCNLCYRVNELPDEFQYDPLTKTYGDPSRRPEVKSSTIEFIAPSEYMLRPPQPAVYLFLLDVSSLAQQSGYLNTVCNTLLEHLENLPGDARTQVGFIAYNSAIHFYNIAEGYNQPHEVTVLDVEDVFLPYPDNLLVNLKECKELIKELLKQLPKRFEHTHDTHSALGAALQVALKLMTPSGGRVTVFQTCLPNIGPGALQSREDPNNRSSKEVAHLGPATDFYKRLALECSGHQIAVDLFLLNSQYCDLATISGISKFSGGCMHHIPLYNESKPQLVKTLRKSLERYLTRKIGFEAVMRVRCTRGLAIHTFHGNFFVRSTDLLSLPNVNPDAGFGMQITYEESLAELKSVCFQAALLYTSSKAERRIRVHTLCIPVTASLTEVMYSADVQCIVGLLSKMAVDRSLSSSLNDARDAFINATVDIFSAFKIAQNLPQNSGTIVAPENLALLPLYIQAILKHPAFRTGTSTRLDDRVFAMCEMKTLPLDQLMRYIYPDFYVLDCLFAPAGKGYVDEGQRPEPPRLQLSAEKLDSRSMFLLDCGAHMFIYIGSNVASSIVRDILGYNSVAEIPDFCIDLPCRETEASTTLINFLDALNEEKPYSAYVQVIRDTSQFRSMLVEKFVDDRSPNVLSYYEFLQHLRTQIK